MKVLFVGNDRFERAIESALERLGVICETDCHRADECRVLYFAYAWHAASLVGSQLVLHFVRRRKPVILHWVGTDVLQVIGDRGLLQGNTLRKVAQRRALLILSRMPNVSHFSAADHLGEELRSVGIQSSTVPMPGPKIRMDVTPLPKQLSAITYIPEGREDFYGLSWVIRLAEDNQDAEFRIVAHSGRGVSAPGNMKFLGWVTPQMMRELYIGSTCVLRLTAHDALASTVLEGVSHGRYAIWTYPAPYAYCVRSYSDLSDAFGQVRRHQEPNTHWAEYVARTFDEDVIYSRWSESFRRASGALL